MKQCSGSAEREPPEIELAVSDVTMCIGPLRIASESATGAAIVRRTSLPKQRAGVVQGQLPSNQNASRGLRGSRQYSGEPLVPGLTSNRDGT